MYLKEVDQVMKDTIDNILRSQDDTSHYSGNDNSKT